MKRKAGEVRRKEIMHVDLLCVALRVALFGMAVVFWGLGIYDMQKAVPLERNISLVCKGAGLTAEELTNIRAQEQETENGMEITAWNRKQMYITDADGCRSICVEAVEISGSSELLLPYGKILHKEDVEGCILGQGAAWELFGSRNVEGLTLCYGERELTIRGVLETPENFIMVETNEANNCFCRITLKTQEGIPKKMSAERFAGSYGIAAEQIRFDLFSKERLLELIPGKWSDFSGWSENISVWRQDAVFLVSVEKSSLEVLWLTLWGKAVLWMGAGAVCLLFGWKSRAASH